MIRSKPGEGAAATLAVIMGLIGFLWIAQPRGTGTDAGDRPAREGLPVRPERPSHSPCGLILEDIPPGTRWSR